MATLTEIRRLIGFKTGDCFVLTATQDSENLTSFTDVVRSANREERAPSIMNRLMVFSQCQEANLGHQAVVRNFQSGARTITYEPASPVAPILGDQVELWSVAERIGSIETITSLINYAISTVKDIAGLEVYADPQDFTLRTGHLEIPATWSEFGGAEYVGRQGMRRSVRSTYMKVQPGLHQVRIFGSGGQQAHRKSVYLFGYLRCPPLVNENDDTSVNTEWIVESVAEAITLARSWASGDAAAAERRANFWAGKAANYQRSVYAGRRGLGIALL